MNWNYALIKLVDEWPLTGLSSSDRSRIKAQLLKAQAAYYRSKANEIGFVKSMRQAFDGIAKILFEAKLLTVEFLENQLRLMVLEAAITGCWWPTDDREKRVEIFPGYFGYPGAWKRFNERDFVILFELTAEWHSKLLEAEADSKVPIESVHATGETIGSQLSALKEECRLTVEELAELIEIQVRSVQRHLAGDSIPYDRHLRAYEREFSKLLNRQIVIRKMS